MTDQDKPQFVQAFGRLVVALREKDPDATTLRVYFDALQDLEIEFVVAAAERLVRGTWFPKVGEWRAAVSALEAERRAAQQALLRRLPAPLCAACDDTGWLHDAHHRVSPCACREQRRLEILGRRPMLALPPASAASPGPLTPEDARAAVADLKRRGGRVVIRIMPNEHGRIPDDSEVG